MTFRDRTSRAPGRRVTKLSGGVALLLGLFAGFVAFAPGASAHHPLVATGSAVCGPETGEWTVSGTTESWVGDTEASQTNASVVVYWAAASAGVAWPSSDTFAVPAGAVSDTSGAFNAANGFAFDYSFTVPASSGLAVGDVVEVIAHTAAPWASGNDGGQWWGTTAGVPVDVVLTSQTDCEPPPCESDPTLPADDPACGVCEEGEVGEFPDCAPPCESDPTLPADDPACGECEEGEVGEFPDCEVVPSLSLDLAGVCDENAPWIEYSVDDGIVPEEPADEVLTLTAAAVEPAAVVDSVDIRWYTIGDPNVLELEQLDMPGSARILWPGAEVDEDGNASDWPGWILQDDGSWVEGDDGFLWATGTVLVEVSHDGEVVASEEVTYPPARPDCNSAPPPTVGGVVVVPPASLPATGGNTTGLLALAGALLLVGLALITGARRREARLH